MIGIPDPSTIARMSRPELIATYAWLYDLFAGGKYTAEEQAQLLLALQRIGAALRHRPAPRP